MLPQPPANVPPPPPSGEELRLKKWRKWILIVGIFSVFFCVIVVLGAPSVTRGSHRKRDLALAVNHARILSLCLHEFHETFGRYPSDDTIALVKAAHPISMIPLGTRSSNDYFRQLLASGTAMDERYFYANTGHSRWPDERFNGSNALEKGECGFAYIARLSSSDSSPDTPIILYPLVPGRMIFDYKFAKKTTLGNAVILRIDGSVITLPVDKTGKVFIDGKDLFDPTQPFWNGKVPDVKWPE